ncbi:MAG: hypothetical protein R3E48_19605 [Burkholderiaceae bacterium]
MRIDHATKTSRPISPDQRRPIDHRRSIPHSCIENPAHFVTHRKHFAIHGNVRATNKIAVLPILVIG